MINGETPILEMRLGHEVPFEHYDILSAIANRGWDWLIEATPEMMGKRIESGHPLVVAYDSMLPDEEIERVDLRPFYGQKIPIVLLETILLCTNGDYNAVPNTYFKLTNNGQWQPVSGSPDTVIMVDLTSSPSRRGINEKVSQLIAFTNLLLSGQTDYELPFDPNNIEHIWTYSPDRPGVLKMHEDNGAQDTGHIIPNTRVPIDSIPHIDRGPIKEEMQRTHLMSYKG